MHFTPRPRWLRIVSMATLVLPVLRSPMMSSRWPRPIGIMASMALMPVWRGSCTGLRPVMPGAWTSRRRGSAPAISPRPSRGSPRGLTTRPSRASPTGTERMLPVALTAWPSSMWPTSPSTTAPIESSSRFSARPSVPPSNSRSSLTAAPGSPLTRAMPSPTSSMRPTWAISVTGSYPSRLRRSALVMSLGSKSPNSGSATATDPLSQLVQTGANAPVDHGVAHPGHDAPQHLGVDHDLHVDGPAGGPPEGLGQAAALVLVQRDGRAHLGGDPLARLGRPAHESAGDG